METQRLAEVVQEISGSGNYTVGQGSLTVYNFTPPARQGEASAREQLLILGGKVRRFWIDGVLRRSVHQAALLEIGKRGVPGAVELAWERVVELPPAEPDPFASTRPIADVFSQAGRFLLILGDPGSGKTTTLLQLAESLLQRAEASAEEPVPVVLNLSTWSARHGTAARWLQHELGEKYQVSQRAARKWLADHRLLLLLDGLDEISPELRAGFVEALHAYVGKHGVPGLVVSSRVAEYDALPTRLKLGGAVRTEPLTPAQIEEYLGHAGERLAALRDGLRADPEWLHLATSPLMLSIMSLAYLDAPAGVVAAASEGSPEARRDRIFDLYVDRVFARRGRRDGAYDADGLEAWLSRLAATMVRQGQTVFRMGQVQPGWLDGWGQRLVYALATRSAVGLLAGVILGISADLINGNNDSRPELGVWARAIVWGVLAGAGAGVIDAFRLRPRKPGRSGSAGFLRARLLPGVLYWAVGFAALLLVARPGWDFEGLGGVGTIFMIMVYAAGGVVFALSFVLGGNRGDPATEISLEGELGWFWRAGVRRGIQCVGATAVLLGVAASVSAPRPPGLLAAALAMIVGLAPPVFVIGAVFGGLRFREIAAERDPDSGVRVLARNALLAAMLVPLAISALPVYVMVASDILPATTQGRIVTTVAFTVCPALLAMLWYGGSNVLEHRVLRMLLARTGLIPRDYRERLDQATQLILMQKVGQGYMFIHRMLMEHLAARPARPDASSIP
ncbi:MAG TPA: NACHT domain-containing protein [Longimicrobium sp.]|nr:NACHT domain-containing protein [Longimicrobium sp.]